MAVVVTFACGHRRALPSEELEGDVRCEQCDEILIRDVSAPPPRIRAVDCDATGPYVTKEE